MPRFDSHASEPEDWSRPPSRLEALGAATLAILHALVEVAAALIVTTLVTVAPPLFMFFLIKGHDVHNGFLYFGAVWLFFSAIAFLLLSARWVHLLADRVMDAVSILPRVYGFDSRTRPPRNPPPPRDDGDDIL